MGVEKHCEILCRKLYSKADVDLFKEKIDDQYNINWVLDNLPAATVFYFDKEKEKKNEDAVECKYLSIFISNFVVLSLVSCTNDYRYMKYVRGRWFARRA